MRNVFQLTHFGAVLYSPKTGKTLSLNHSAAVIAEHILHTGVEQTRREIDRLGANVCIDEIHSMLSETDCLNKSTRTLIKQNISKTPGVLPAPTQVFLLLTRDCNLHCKHCFAGTHRSQDRSDMSTQQITSLVSSLEEWGVPCLSLTGGEPLLRADFMEIVAHAYELGMPLSLTTNGLLVNDRMASFLAELKDGFRFMHISLDGPKQVHDCLRGEGVYEQAMKAVNRLHKVGIDVGFSITLSALCMLHLRRMFKTASTLGVHSLSFADIKPSGNASKNPELFDYTLNQRDEAWSFIYEEKQETDSNIYVQKVDPLNPTAPLLHKYLDGYRCIETCSIDSDGQMTPCTFIAESFKHEGYRFPNVNSVSPQFAWQNGEAFRFLRSIKPPVMCKGCQLYRLDCGGGCNSRSYAYKGSFKAVDPFCSKSQVSKDIPVSTLFM